MRPDGTLLADYQLAIDGVPLRMFRVTRFEKNAPAFASWKLEPTGETLGQVLLLQQ